MTAVQSSVDAGLLLLQFAQQSSAHQSQVTTTIKVSPDGAIKEEKSPRLEVANVLDIQKPETKKRKKSVESDNTSVTKKRKNSASTERKKSVDSSKSVESTESKRSRTKSGEPKPLTGVELLKAHNIGFSELSALFHLSINEAAKELGVCATVLKRVCRKHSIVRWPQRKIRSLDRCIESVEKMIATQEFSEKEKTRMIRKLGKMKQKRELLLSNPNAKVNLRSNIRFNTLNAEAVLGADCETPSDSNKDDSAQSEGSDDEDVC